MEKSNFSKNQHLLSSEKGQLREKVFQVRDSKLTQLFAFKDVKSSFNIIFAFVVWSFLINLVFFVTQPAEIYAFKNFIKSSIRGFDDFCFFELLFHILIFLIVYPTIRCWIYLRHNQKSKLIPDIIFGFVNGTLFIFVYAYAFYQIFEHQLPPSIRLAILCEKVRLTMKIVAFIIECRHKQERCEIKGDPNPMKCFSSAKQLLYFLFIPTIIYRDHYPRTQNVRWSFVATYLLQFLIGLIVLYLIFYRFVIPSFSLVGLQKFALRDFLTMLFYSLLTGGVLQMFSFYLFLHCWMNLWAELLRFGDRTFYQDWWNSTSYSAYYRKWNCVVHDWIYNYFYIWAVKKTNGNKGLSTFFILVLSSIIHEYIISASFGFFFPVLSIQFAGIGSICLIIELLIKKIIKQNQKNDKDHRVSKSSFYSLNFLIVSTLISGWSSMFVLYTMEYYARQNCLSHKNLEIGSYFYMHTLKCLEIYN